MRIALDPVPLVLGIYAHVSEVLGRAAERRAADTAEALGPAATPVSGRRRRTARSSSSSGSCTPT